MLAHYVHDGVLLEEKSCRSVLKHTALLLWGYGVKLHEIEAANDQVLKTYDAGDAKYRRRRSPTSAAGPVLSSPGPGF